MMAYDYPRSPPLYALNSNYYYSEITVRTLYSCEYGIDINTDINSTNILCLDDDGNFLDRKRVTCSDDFINFCYADGCSGLRGLSCPFVQFDFLDHYGRLISTCNSNCLAVEPVAIQFVPEKPVDGASKYYVIQQPSSSVTIECPAGSENYMNLACAAHPDDDEVDCSSDFKGICRAAGCDSIHTELCMSGIDLYDTSGRRVDTCTFTDFDTCESIYAELPVPTNPGANFLVQQDAKVGREFFLCDKTQQVGDYYNVLCDLDGTFEEDARFDCVTYNEACVALWRRCSDIPARYCVKGVEIYDFDNPDTPFLKCKSYQCSNESSNDKSYMGYIGIYLFSIFVAISTI